MAWAATLGKASDREAAQKENDRSRRCPSSFQFLLENNTNLCSSNQHYQTLGHRFQPPPTVALTMVTLGDLCPLVDIFSFLLWPYMLTPLPFPSPTLVAEPSQACWVQKLSDSDHDKHDLLCLIPLLPVAGDQVTTMHPRASNSTRWPWAMTDMNQKERSPLTAQSCDRKRKTLPTTLSYLNRETIKTRIRGVFLLKNCLLGNS